MKVTFMKKHPEASVLSILKLASPLSMHNATRVKHFIQNKQRYLMPEGINARVSRYYICWHSITIVCYTFVQQLEICN